MNITDDFIGVFPDAVSPDVCANIIERFDKADELGFTLLRSAPRSEQDDSQLFIQEIPLHSAVDSKSVIPALQALQACYLEYANKYSVALTDASDKHASYQFKVQKTNPSQGYHVWHYEQSQREMGSRILAWTMYLNTIEEGGETEFLYQKRRVKPEQGTICIFPAGFTHVHRGNPPLSGSKYIATGWYEF